MIIAILVLLFVVVFAVLAWRIIVQSKPNADEAPVFVCPHCDETGCDCHQQEP